MVSEQPEPSLALQGALHFGFLPRLPGDAGARGEHAPEVERQDSTRACDPRLSDAPVAGEVHLDHR
jgi:hypothetical protein